MIVVVTPNPAIDVTYPITKLEVGQEHRVLKPRLRPGGKGFNVARVLAQIGEPCVMVTLRGGRDGALLADLLAHHEPALADSTRWVPIANSIRRTVAIVDDGGATLFNEGGPAVSLDEWDRLDAEVRGVLSDGDVLVVSGSTPIGSPSNIAARLVEIATAAGALSLVDTSGLALLEAADAGASAVKPNLSELMAVATIATLQEPCASIGTVAEAAQELIRRGVTTVMTSAGPNGIVAIEAGITDRFLRAVPPELIQGNATGAGDAAVAALARALSRDSSTSESICDAVALSAAAVLAPVAGEVDLDAYQRFRMQTSVETLTKEDLDAFS